jgi:hypothetical protein
MTTDVLGIYYNKRDDGTLQYRCRGFGRKYELLYRWLPTTSYRCTGEDFPWDYFVFDDPQDHVTMCQMFAGDVMDDGVETL